MFLFSLRTLRVCFLFSLITLRDWSKGIWGVGRSREGVGQAVFSLVQEVSRAIFSYR